VKAIVNPLTTYPVYLALKSRWIQRDIFSIAVANPATLTDETLIAFTRLHIATSRRWQRLRRFYRMQLERENNLEAMQAVPGMKQFTRPTLILWGQPDGNFGIRVAQRLAEDIPGAQGVQLLSNSGHLPMLEEPEAYVEAVLDFLEK
jgi:pimeloyl-ACP methyl ester carboxylesterase